MATARPGNDRSGERARPPIVPGHTNGRVSGVLQSIRRRAAPTDRPVPPMAGTAAVGAVVHLLATTQVEKFAPAQAASLVVPG